MALKKYRFPCCIGVHNPAEDEPEVRDKHTNAVIRHATNGIRYVPAGEFVEMEDAEAKRIVGIVGTWEAREARLGPALATAQQAASPGGKVTVMKSADITSI